MSELNLLLPPSSVLTGVRAGCKREALGIMARHAAKAYELEAQDILDTILERERLGSTGVGNGIAIPHGKLADLDQMVAVVARLEEPVGYDAVDSLPVDLLVMLLAPAQSNAEHLKVLSRISRLLRQEEVRSAMRGAKSGEALHAIVVDNPRHEAA